MFTPIATEAYPTRYRTIGYALIIVIGCIYILFQPFLLSGLYSIQPGLPLIFFTTIMLIASIAVYFLKESRTANLDNLEKSVERKKS
jgi:hypothetical protein